jgi:hypothetical protein
MMVMAAGENLELTDEAIRASLACAAERGRRTITSK